MTKIIMMHSFRRGVGKSSLVANMAALFAQKGQRVGIVDTNIQAPSLHFVCNLSEDEITYSFNHFLWQQCTIRQAVYNVTDKVFGNISGQIFLVPATCQPSELVRVLSKSYSIEPLNAALLHLAEELELEVLLLEPQIGLNPESLSLIAISDILLLLMRLDQQDYQGTSILIDVIRKLNVPELLLLVNEVPSVFDIAEVRMQVAKRFQCQIAGIIPHTSEMMLLGSTGIFVLRYPSSLLTELYEQIANKLIR